MQSHLVESVEGRLQPGTSIYSRTGSGVLEKRLKNRVQRKPEERHLTAHLLEVLAKMARLGHVTP